MVIMNKRDGLFFLVLLVMRITYGTRVKNLLFLPMKSDNVSTTEAGALLMADARIACRICRAKGETPMNCRTDKSMYAPNETVCVYVDGLPAETVSLRLILSHLEKTVLTEEIAAAERFSLLPPSEGRQGIPA